jgi:hypothetical protein
VFAALNTYWICRLLLERLPVKLSADEQRLCELVFRTMTPREMIKLLKLATWKNAEAGECFVERDKPLDRLMVTYASLSAIARAITGTAWSGPRFFALRPNGAPMHSKNKKSVHGSRNGSHGAMSRLSRVTDSRPHERTR